MNIMKISIIFTSIILFSGCSNLYHKSFRLVSHGKGGKVTLADPAGTNNPAPSVVFGQFTSSITTVVPGTILEAEVTTYQFWTGDKSFTERIYIDATKAKFPVKVKVE